ncbi:MAG: hypothetical protein U0270_05235 [Labilithrix sp.]
MRYWSVDSVSSLTRFRIPRSVLIASAVMLVVRVAWILRFREIDSDAYGHYFIAIAARRDPGNIDVHWVWLPLFHFLVGALTKVGLTFRGVRFANALLATLPPLLVWDARRDEDARWAAIAFALSPLLTVLGQSAQPETLFLVFVVAAVHASTRGWPVRAGVWLALACMVRYEAWGAALAIGGAWLWKERTRTWLAFAAIPAAVVALYVLFRWWTDGTLLLFLRGTRDITKVQVAREAWTLRSLVDFPIILPWRIIGPAIFAAPLGWKALGARERALLAGFAAFLLLSYYSGGSHAGERYLVSLTPFAWIAIGAGWSRRREVMLALVGLTTIWHLHRAAAMAIDWDEGLREREQKLEEDRVRP